MRAAVPCPDILVYAEDPKSFLPDEPTCLNNPAHKPQWNAHWKRGLCLDHVHTTKIPIFNAYCEECRETISYWPEPVLPYQREPLETIEQVVIENLEGSSVRESAARIGYDPRTVSRWIKLAFTQAIDLLDQAIRRILGFIGTEILPLTFEGARVAAGLLLAWLRRLAEMIRFPRLNRLMGICNLIGKGDWDLWGAPLGRARSRVSKTPAPA